MTTPLEGPTPSGPLLSRAMAGLPGRVFSLLSFILTPSLSLAQSPPTPPPIDITIDPRIELLNIVCRLAAHPESTTARISSYSDAVDAYFQPFSNHDAVQLARKNRARYDAPASLAIHLSPPPQLDLLLPLNPWPPTLDPRWQQDPLADQFLPALRRFYKDTNFPTFLSQHKDLYTLTTTRLNQTLQANAHLTWFTTFFGPQPNTHFHLVPSLLNSKTNYGPSLTLPDGPGAGHHIYCILSVWSREPADGSPRFPSRITPTLIHEFTHAYINPLVDAHLNEFEPAARKLFARNQQLFRQHGTSNWRTMTRESLVRACVIRYLQTHHGPAAANEESQLQQSLGYTQTPALSTLLANYESHRTDYPTLTPFMPRILDFFNTYTPPPPQPPP